MGLATLVCVALGLRRHRSGRPLPAAAGPVEPVLLLGVGLGAVVMSDAARSIVPMTSTVFVLTALVALVGYPVTLTAVVRMVQGRRRGRSGDIVVEAGLLALAFGLCAWALLSHAGQPVPFPVMLAAIALPAADVAVLVVTGAMISALLDLSAVTSGRETFWTVEGTSRESGCSSLDCDCPRTATVLLLKN